MTICNTSSDLTNKKCWITPVPEKKRVHHKRLETAITALYKLHPNLRCFLLARQGETICEVYADCDETSLHDLRSATKTVVGILVGIASSHGLMPALEESIKPYFEAELPQSNKNDPLWSSISLYHLLTMTSGLHWQTGPKLGEQWIHRFHNSASWTRFALRLPVHAEFMNHFQYRSIDSHLLSVLLTRITGMRADQYAERHLFGPLGIINYRWALSPDGDASGHIGLHLSGRDMLKIGQLMLDKGIIRDNNVSNSTDALYVIPSEWIKETMRSHHAGMDAYGNYGYQGWSHRLQGYDAFCALGHGGQMIYIVPELDIVVVLAGNSHVRRWRHPRLWLEQHLLPACLSY
ncbi:serine hydrolase [Paenibacillus sp. UMB4589-SE434]|uniref:serine hydrolase domain-containing protein n=1 Tax=Paenibacillus sp. UMB4589-SE434 TaxID=3046314 RepID=UPI00254B3AED|nr:serine hydrolase [Paenibacillus sp. UMB4589-SE434]MDK8182865.1 serine hydrolase [Paenibacillus sp. UMB4589-SE434]